MRQAALVEPYLAGPNLAGQGSAAVPGTLAPDVRKKIAFHDVAMFPLNISLKEINKWDRFFFQKSETFQLDSVEMGRG